MPPMPPPVVQHPRLHSRAHDPIKAGLRRPQASDQWYSKTVDQWGDLSAAQKKKYSHIGRIEETSAGVKDQKACAYCTKKRFICRKYRPSVVAAGTLTSGRSQAGDACSRCRMHGQKCVPAPDTVELMTKEELVAEVRRLRAKDSSLRNRKESVEGEEGVEGEEIELVAKFTSRIYNRHDQ
jgi:hypothetical protein